MPAKKEIFRPLHKAIQLLGGQTGVAKVCSSATGRKIGQQHVFNWLNRDHNVPSDCAMAISIAVREKGEEISHEALCPGYAWHLTEKIAEL